ncbi:hypothetical protein KIPB_017078, partial [Kipferlia bialata]|eukprot:g17078.t1
MTLAARAWLECHYQYTPFPIPPTPQHSINKVGGRALSRLTPQR